MKKKAPERKKKTSPFRKNNPSGGISSSSRKYFSNPVLVIAGEHSGDMLAGDLIRVLKKKGAENFFGTGGDHMIAAGADLVENIRNMNIMGFVEAFRAYRRLKALAVKITDLAVEKKTRLAVLVDYPGFNLRLAEMLKAKGIKVVYLVSPQIWAWKYGRIKNIKKYVDLMLVLFPFEKEIYDEEHVKCELIGHPLVKRIPLKLKEGIPIKKTSGITVGLLPGSRRSEVMRHLGPMLDAASILQKKFGNIRFLIPCADSSLKQFMENEISARKKINTELYDGNSLRVMEASQLLILSSGTATLEGAFFKKPMIVIYDVKLINFLIASVFARVRFISLVNILARHQVILELIQKEISPSNIATEAEKILTDRKYREKIISELEFVLRQLGKGNPALKAAEAILKNI